MLQGKSYVPLLKARTSEVEAYNFLSPEVKERCFPVFLLRPWPNASFLDLSVKRITDATQGQTFGLGLDKERYGYQSNKEAQREFDELCDSDLGYKQYFDFLESIPEAVPVLQPTMDANNLLRQLGNAVHLDRGLVVHQQRGVQIPLTDTVLSLPPLPTDTIFIVDAAWGRDPLQMEAWAIPIVQRIQNALPETEIVVMASSFPDSFSHIVGDAEEPAFENILFESVRQQLQGANLFYGDWGSTRLPQSGGGGRIPPRVDLARPSSWHIFRAAPDGDDTYLDIATAARTHPNFVDVPQCWGKAKIEETNGDKKVGVTGTKMNTSVRINTHMTLRAGTTEFNILDEHPYRD